MACSLLCLHIACGSKKLHMTACCKAPGLAAAGQLAELPIPRLETRFNEADAQWLYKLARGCDTEEVGVVLSILPLGVVAMLAVPSVPC